MVAKNSTHATLVALMTNSSPFFEKKDLKFTVKLIVKSGEKLAEIDARKTILVLDA